MRRAFTLVELVIVVVIIGLIAAIAIPSFSSAGVLAPAKQLRRDLAVLRTAIDRYHYQHGAYPGQRAARSDVAPAGSEAAFVLQLTRFTNKAGQVSDVRSDTYRFGPYLVHGVPACPVSKDRNSAQRFHLIAGEHAPTFDPSTPAGWIVNIETGYIAANSDEQDRQGLRFDRY